MVKTIPRLSTNLNLYKRNKHLFEQHINTDMLPVYGESKIYKHTVERYGHVKIKLDIDKELYTNERYNDVNYTYEWAISDTAFENTHPLIMPLPIEFEPDIYKEVITFAQLLQLLNKNDVPLCFSIVGGSCHYVERPCHIKATGEALIQLLEKLNNA